MRKVILITVIALLIFLILAWFMGNLLGLKGSSLWILRGALWLVGFVAAAVVIWFFWQKKKEEELAAAAAEESTPAGGEEIAVLLRDAEKKLSGAKEKGARIGNLPTILLVGETSSTKTSILLHSGLEPELLAGQIYQDGNVTSTRSANLWFSRRTLFVEAGGKLLENNAAWTTLIRRLQPRKLGAVMGKGGQSPRAALVCVEIERVAGDQQVMAASARALRTKLGEISQTFGIQLPVYVLFTKTDRLAFFADFVRNLSNEEATQVLGTTLPMSAPSAGIYAEEQTARLSGVFDSIFRSLAAARPELLSREAEAAKLPGTYEFPREFRKLRAPLVQFLVDLCRPSQLTVGPYLRGFYFSAVRPVIVRETTTMPERTDRPTTQNAAKEATAMFRIPVAGQPATSTPQSRVVGTRKVPQWIFLGHLFNDVLLADKAAMGASGASAKADTWRRVLLISAAALFLIFCIGFTVSFFLNRSLESQVNQDLLGTSATPPATGLAPVDSLRRLEALRQSLETLTAYNREGAPWRYRWGLYVGNDLYPEVYRLYFQRFKKLLFGQTQNSLVTYLNGLPPTPAAAQPYDQTYNALKAYLITTSNHDKSTRDFLPPELLATWSAGQTVDADRTQLARTQFEFYSDELRLQNPFAKENDAKAVANARSYLKQFAGLERVYQAMKADASKTAKPINFNVQFPGSKDFVVDSYDVAGPFTRDGWVFMQKAIRNPNKYVHGEPWVLGDEGTSVNTDPASLIVPLLARYQTDFINQWRNYLKNGGVAKYKDLKDASAKLIVLAGNQSPLLELFSLASRNTFVDDDQIKNAFQPVQATTPPTNTDRYVDPANQSYLDGLGKLQATVEAAAGLPNLTEGAAGSVLTEAQNTRATVRHMAGSFRIDSDSHLDVQRLLEEPITNTEAKVKGAGPEELNGKGKALCAQLNAALRKYPFDPKGTTDATVADLDSVFKKPDGALWKFYQDSLEKLLPKQGNQYVPVPGAITLTPAFVNFFNRAAEFGEALYAGGPDATFSYTLKWVPTEGVQGVDLQIDGQSLSAKPFVWKGSGPHGVKASVKLEGGAPLTFSEQDGLWAIFRLFGEADTREVSGAGEVLTWVYRSGVDRKPVKLENGHPLTVKLQLVMAGGPSVFQKGFFSRLACVADVAKK